MATQLMIYESAVPVGSQRHRALSVRGGKEFGFAHGLNSVPLPAAEFGASVGEYPIVFAGPDDAVMPTAILGRRDGENLFLDDGGTWSAKYVPAFIRRYPFVFARPDAGEAFTLCVDEKFSGCN
jgi:hypothetical protein